MQPEQATFQVGGIVFCVSVAHATGPADLGQAYRGFLCSGVPEVVIEARYEGLPAIALHPHEMVFDSAGLWRLYRVDQQNVFPLRSPQLGPQPYRIAVFDADYRHGTVYSHRPPPGMPPDSLLLNPLEYPLSEVLMTCLLARGRGLMVHACGVADGGRGFLFAGNSAHGKTTLSRLWANHACVLNDDRIVLRERDGRFWMFGTPWHGEYTGVSPQGVPLERVFFLHHAETNGAERRDTMAAVSLLMTRSFLPLWDAEGVGFSIDFCARVTASIPCYELGFVPDGDVVGFVRGVV